MSLSNPGFGRTTPRSRFELDFPQPVGIYDTYEEAQKAVDYLADNDFEVQNLEIVGTELKQVERVLGRRNWGTVVGQGVQSGITTGLLVGIVLILFAPPHNAAALVVVALGIGIGLGVGFQALGYAMSRGRRDFTSVTQVVAMKYEVLSEHKVAAKARTLLSQMPGTKAAYFR